MRDSGPGLDPASLEHLFDAFYTTKSTGLGMGLSICRSIVEAHGGRIWAEADVPQGAAFQFTLSSQAASRLIEPRSTVSEADVRIGSWSCKPCGESRGNATAVRGVSFYRSRWPAQVPLRVKGGKTLSEYSEYMFSVAPQIPDLVGNGGRTVVFPAALRSPPILSSGGTMDVSDPKDRL